MFSGSRKVNPYLETHGNYTRKYDDDNNGSINALRITSYIGYLREPVVNEIALQSSLTEFFFNSPVEVSYRAVSHTHPYAEHVPGS